MSVIGYKRVSSVSQSTERQELGEVDKLFEENKVKKRKNFENKLNAKLEDCNLDKKQISRIPKTKPQ